LRHTWASWPVKQERPLHGLKELGVWKDVKGNAFAHLSPEHQAEHASKIENFCDKFTTLTFQAQKNQLLEKANWLIL
jgi:hypothetical protein